MERSFYGRCSLVSQLVLRLQLFLFLGHLIPFTSNASAEWTASIVQLVYYLHLFSVKSSFPAEEATMEDWSWVAKIVIVRRNRRLRQSVDETTNFYVH